MVNPNMPNALEIADGLDETHRDAAIRQGTAAMDRLHEEAELARQRLIKRLTGDALKLTEATL